jgi:small-conductance mechanosensitive channel
VRALLIASALVLLPAAAATSSAMPAVRSGHPGAAPGTPAPATSPVSPAPAPAAPAEPDTVPVPEVAQRAEEVARLVRDLEASLRPVPVIVTIEKRLPEIVERSSALSQKTARQLDASPTAAVLNELTDQWRTNRDLLTAYVETLAQRARALEESLARLTSLRATWTRARTDARASRAPAAVVERIDGVLTAVGSVRAQMETQRAATLLLQDRLAREVAQCEAILARITAVRMDIPTRLLEQDSVPIWNTAELARGLAELPERIRQAATASAAQLGQFASEQRRKLGLQLVLFAALSALMVVARRTVTDGGAVFGRPLSAGLLLTILTTWWIHLPAPPRAAVAVFEVLALMSALRLMRLLIAPDFTPRLNVLAALFAADLLRHLASIVPLLEQQIFLLEMLAGIAVLGWEIRSRPQNRPTAMRALLAVLVVALGAAMAGYMTLGLLLGAGVVGSGYLALILGAGLRVADGLVSLALRTPPLARLWSVERHRPLLERRAHRVLHLVAVATWVVFALRYLGLWNTAADVTRAALAAELKRGALSLSLGDVVVFLVTVGAAFVLSGLIRFGLEEDVYPRLRVGRGLPSVLSTLLHFAILFVGFLVALAALGLDLTKVTILAGAFGVGIGFGLQGVVNNFVSGLILLVERRIDVGDAVQIGDVAGQVQQMGMRACTIRTWEGAEVIVPNATLVSDKVANWTLSDRLRRIDVAVGVAYGTQPEKVMEVLLGVARAHKQVLLEPAPIALFLGFGESSLRFELRVWTDRFDLWLLTQSELAVAVYEALRAASIEIPFPQREVRLRS